MICDYEGCWDKAKYCIEWWGLNQHGENPIVADECYVCSNPKHLIELSQHRAYGGYPDEIHSIETYEVKSKLLSLVEKVIDGELELETIDNLVLIADPPKEQLQLFSEH